MLLNILFYGALIALVVVLGAGLVNLVVRSRGQSWRSNRLMRVRVAVQLVLVALLVAAGFLAGMI